MSYFGVGVSFRKVDSIMQQQTCFPKDHSCRRIGHAALSDHPAVSKQLLPVYDNR